MNKSYFVLVNLDWAKLYVGLDENDSEVLEPHNLGNFICSEIENIGNFTIIRLSEQPHLRYYVPNIYIHGIVEFEGERPKLGF